METLDREILSRDVYECWQEPCSDIEPFFQISDKAPKAWVLGLGRYGRASPNPAMVAWSRDERAIVIFSTLWEHYHQCTLVPHQAFQRLAWTDLHGGVLDYVKNLFSPSVLLGVYDPPLLPRADVESTQLSPDVARFVLEQRWIEKHRYEFAGKWVALEGETLLASGDSARAVYRRAHESGAQRPLVVKVERPDQPPFAGW